MFELSETGNQSVIDLVEYRSELKTILDEFYSVQFFLKRKGILYQFKLRTTSLNKPCIIVKKDSPVFTELQVGDILDMKYNNPESLDTSRLFKTQIISKNPLDCYTGHSIVELSIINNIEEKLN
ncbi:MAG TPA: hypothetical protein VLM43_01825 [Desulfobacterales bacterium]|nr:hypothetical protein [Desulfobacterales bacterium]